MLSVNEKLSEFRLLCLRVTFHALPLFICERKFYARTYAKITRHWKSTPSEYIDTQIKCVSFLSFDILQVAQVSSFLAPLADLAVGAASRMADVQRKVDLLDQAKTVAESAAQLMYATKEGGGNPKVN